MKPCKCGGKLYRDGYSKHKDNKPYALRFKCNTCGRRESTHLMIAPIHDTGRPGRVPYLDGLYI